MTSHGQESTTIVEIGMDEATDLLPPNGTVTLHLLKRTVTFPGQRVTSIPDLFHQPALRDDEVYLTAKGNVAVYDPNRWSVTVHDLDDFVDTYLETPVSFIVDEVLAAMPRIVEALDI